MTAHEAILTAIARRHAAHRRTPNGLHHSALITEPGINLGLDHPQRRADAIVVTYTGARHVIGYEIKVSRSDWLRELRQEDKSDWWRSQCHAWWLASTPSVARLGELPDGWGHLELRGTRLWTAREATVYPARVPSWDASRSLLRRLHHQLTQDEEE